MKAFHSPDSLRHKPGFYFRHGRMIQHFEQPARYQILVDALKRGRHTLILATEFDREHLVKVHSERYVTFLSEAWQRRDEIGDQLEFILPSHFATPDMVRYPPAMTGRVGFHMSDTSTAVYGDTLQAIRSSANVALSAAEAIAAGDFHVYALCRPPGHHASAERAGGFCFLNNTAIASKFLNEALNCKVGIIDVDVHHGNGTQSIFYDLEEIITCSVHADTSCFMPFYSGFIDENGTGPGFGCNLNVPLAHRSSDTEFLDGIERALAFAIGHKIGALVIALGLDASENDPNGALSVTGRGFHQAGQLLGSVELPTLIVQEGGYLSADLADNLLYFLEGFESARSTAGRTGSTSSQSG